MKKIVIIFCFVLWSISQPVFTQKTNQYLKEYDAKVLHVVDGDTIHVQDTHGLKRKIRFANIDAPEMNQRKGRASRENLLFLNNKNVKVKIWNLDRYQREVADVFYLGNNIGLFQVAKGYAWVYIYYAQKKLSAAQLLEYKNIEQQARKERKGLWQDKNPIPPWIFRENARPL